MSDQITLYPHNVPTYNAIKDAFGRSNNLCFTQGTGVGKSYVFMRLADEVFAMARIAYVSPKQDIFDNLLEYPEFKKLKERVTFYCNSYFNSEERSEQVYRENDLIVVDEAHHIGSDFFGKNLRYLLKLVKESTGKFFLGMTATPFRVYDRVDVRQYFDENVTGMTAFDCIHAGLMPQIEYLLCPPKATEEEKRRYRIALDLNESADILEGIIRRNEKNRWLVYFSTFTQMDEGMETVKRLFDGYEIVTITSRTQDAKNTIRKLGSQKVVIVSISKLLEGIHLSGIDAVLLFRRVTSLNVFQQILGRIQSIGGTHEPLFVDCTNTGKRMMRELLKEDKAQSGFQIPGTQVRDILKIGVGNEEIFDISRFLAETSDVQKTVWTAQEVETLRANYPKGKDACMSALPRFTWRQLQTKASALHLTTPKEKYPREEVEAAIREYYADYGAKRIKELFPGITAGTISNIAVSLGVRKKRSTAWTDQEISWLKAHPEASREELIRKLPRHPISAIRQKQLTLGIRDKESAQEWTPAMLDILAANRDLSAKELHEQFFPEITINVIDRARRKYGVPKVNGKDWDALRPKFEDAYRRGGWRAVKALPEFADMTLGSITSKARTFGVQSDTKKFVFRGKEYASLRACCLEYGVSYKRANKIMLAQKLTKKETMNRMLG